MGTNIIAPPDPEVDEPFAAAFRVGNLLEPGDTAWLPANLVNGTPHRYIGPVQVMKVIRNTNDSFVVMYLPEGSEQPEPILYTTDARGSMGWHIRRAFRAYALKPGERVEEANGKRFVIQSDEDGEIFVGRIEPETFGEYLGCLDCGQGLDDVDAGMCVDCREDRAYRELTP